MTTATKTPSAHLAKLQEARDKAHVPVLEARRKLNAYDAETEAKRGTLTALVRTNPEEFEGPTHTPREGTEAAQLAAEVRQRRSQPNPHQDEYEKAQAEFLRRDQELQDWLRRNVRARIEEVQADAREAVDQIREGFEALRSGSDRYRVAIEEVRSIVISTPGMDGQDYGHDPRPDDWRRLAEDALDGEIVLPQLSPMGNYKADRDG
jgi:hypothetical protein